MNTIITSIAFTIIAFAYIYSHKYWNFRQTKLPILDEIETYKEAHEMLQKKQITTVEWSPEKNFAKRIVQKYNVPVKILNAPVKSWKAFNPIWRSTDEFLKDMDGDLPLRRVRKQVGSSLFTLGERHVKYQDGLHWDLQEMDVKLKDLVSRDRKDEYWYFSGPMEDLRSDFESFFEPRDDFVLDKERFRTIVWIGQKGTNSQLHYDEPDNFFVQVLGRKRFILFPSSEWAFLYNYPHQSTHRRQCKVNPETFKENDKFPDFTRAVQNGISVILEPGDLIYVPPMYYHYVTALDFSVSVSMLNPSKEQIALAQLDHMPILNTLQKFPKGKERILLSRLYVVMLAEEFYGSLRLVQKMIKVRYGSFHQENSFNCYSSVDQNTNPQARSFLKPFVDQTMKVLRGSGIAETSVIELRLGDHIEEVAATTVEKDDIEDFLWNCLVKS